MTQRPENYKRYRAWAECELCLRKSEFYFDMLETVAKDRGITAKIYGWQCYECSSLWGRVKRFFKYRFRRWPRRFCGEVEVQFFYKDGGAPFHLPPRENWIGALGVPLLARPRRMEE